MPVFEYKDYSDPKDFSDNPHASNCPYCTEKLKRIDLKKDFWSVSNEDLLSIHEGLKPGYKEIHGLEDCYLDLRIDTQSFDIWVNYCQTCGWWRLIKDVCICAGEWQMWDIFFGCVGTLKNLSLNDIQAPLEEVNSYLVVKYENRFSINPRRFEEVVASVFRSIGYHVDITAYSNDGGIDVLFEEADGNRVGVQVKRYKNKIKAEQIRAFAGALILSGCNRGVFVTTSNYQRGAIETAKRLSAKTLPIELIDANKFYDVLKMSSRREVDIDGLKKWINKNGIPDIYSYGWDTPRNSL